MPASYCHTHDSLPVTPVGDMVVADCGIPANCVNWEMPSKAMCDPCIDLDDPDAAIFMHQAWQTVTSYLYDQTNCMWPGACFEEIVRPCLRTTCKCSQFKGCARCGVYEYLPLSGATCLPILELKEVWIGPNPCNQQCGKILTPGRGVRLEYMFNEPRIVLQDKDGCCGTWPSQDLCAPTGCPGTWHITFHTGIAPPKYMIDGAWEMANELVKSCLQTGCRLPGNLTRKSFDGTSTTVDPDVGVSLSLRMLEKILDRSKDDAWPVEQFGMSSDTQWHRVSGPNPVSACMAECCV